MGIIMCVLTHEILSEKCLLKTLNLSCLTCDFNELSITISLNLFKYKGVIRT